jgi:hypothetical protein
MVEAERAGATHFSFKVRKRIFAYYTFNHHGDGVVALWCKAPPGERDRLVEENPGRYFVPPYLGSRGWVALRLDTARVDWKAVKELAFVSYFMTAPAGLSRPVGKGGPAKRSRSGRRRTSGCS